jgi:D-alanyl-D-alanine carboxypeptidase/D-alanyl-D-alanine-endopeptidase (penicillin-binding protein 4)
MPSFVRWLGLLGVAALLGSTFGCTAMTAAGRTTLPNLYALAGHARVSVLVVRLRDMHIIAALNPDLRLRPASVSKLFAASAALQQFGPGHRFTSRFTSHGRLVQGTLQGDLIFVGGGSPTLDNPHLHQLVTRLKARGVDKVKGNLVVDQGLWGQVPCSTQDRCDARERAAHSYSAPLSSAGVNFGTVHITLYPGARAGSPSRVVLHPADLPGYRIDNRVKTGKAHSKAGIVAWRTYDGSSSLLHIKGSLPAGYGAYDFHRAVTGAAAETGRVLLAMLGGAGIQVTGQPVVRSGHVNQEGAVLAKIDSTTLAEQLIPMLDYSNNYMADTLALDVAAATGYSRPLTLARAAKTLEALSRRANSFAYPDLARGHARFDSGSGLSLGNAASARDLVSLLAYMFHKPAVFPAFYGSIPVPMSAPSRTLKQGDFDFESRLVAKTGTLTEPVTVRGLAGYFRLADGGFAAYAIVINGTSSNPDLTYRQTVTAYQHDLESILASN